VGQSVRAMGNFVWVSYQASMHMECDEALHVTIFIDDIRMLQFNGSFYTCFTLPELYSPYSENETIRLFLQDAPNRAALMTGRQGNYTFNLYLDRMLVHYDLLQNDEILLNVTTAVLNQGGHLVIHRSESEITILYENMLVGMARIADEVLNTIRFTDICVGGGFF